MITQLDVGFYFETEERKKYLKLSSVQIESGNTELPYPNRWGIIIEDDIQKKNSSLDLGIVPVKSSTKRQPNNVAYI